MSIHDPFDLQYWITQFPLERLRAEAREFVLKRRTELPEAYPSEPDVDQHIQLMEPRGQILMGPANLAINEQLRAEAFTGEGYRGVRVATDVFVWASGEAPNPAMTKIGGTPYRPRSSPWPRDDEGRPVRFIAQLCFADSRDIVGDLPGDVLLIFGNEDALLTESERLLFEWSSLGIRELASEVPHMTCCEPLKPYFGVIHRTADWPDALDHTPRLLAVFEGTKIGGLPSFIQDEPSPSGRFLAAVGSISAGYSAFPLINESERHEWSPGDIMIGDMGSLYLFLDRHDRVHALSQYY